MPFVFVFLMVFSSLSRAQHPEQPLAESNADLRSNLVLFSVELPKDKKTFLLERTAGQDYFLRLKVKGEEKIQKVPGREAQRLDRDFASRFLRCQYEIPSAQGKCEVTLRLSMKGEGQEICQKDDLKTQEISTFLTELSNRF